MVDEVLPDMDVELYFGRPHHGFQGIHRAYDEAREKMLGGNNPDKIRYYYPLELEIKIINYMRIGHFEDAEEICRQIREENQRRQLLPGEAGRLRDCFLRCSTGFLRTCSLNCREIPVDMRKQKRFRMWITCGTHCWKSWRY